MDGLWWKTLLKWMIWGPTPISGNTHMYLLSVNTSVQWEWFFVVAIPAWPRPPKKLPPHVQFQELAPPGRTRNLWSDHFKTPRSKMQSKNSPKLKTYPIQSVTSPGWSPDILSDFDSNLIPFERSLVCNLWIVCNLSCCFSQETIEKEGLEAAAQGALIACGRSKVLQKHMKWPSWRFAT